MRLTEWFTSLNVCKKYADNEQLFRGLAALDSKAIMCLQMKALPAIQKAVKSLGLPREQAEELVNDSTLVFLQKIESGAYVFQGYAPTTYLIEVAKRMAYAKTRRRRPANEALEAQYDLGKEEWNALEKQQALADLVRQFLGRLSEECARVIRLHHLEGYRDEEVIEQGMTPYSTINSLKVKRSTCMKKLIVIAQAWKSSKTI
jgi:DNA-directed RNA polymerase specialized sigma24 family protein